MFCRSLHDGNMPSVFLLPMCLKPDFRKAFGLSECVVLRTGMPQHRIPFLLEICQSISSRFSLILADDLIKI